MVLVLIFLFFFQPIVSREWFSWNDYRNINRIKTNTINEHNYRKSVYLENLAKIKEHNDKFAKGLVLYSLKMNHFGHLTAKEFTEKYTSRYDDNQIKPAKIYEPPKNFTLPATIDWRFQDAVTPVKSQGRCKICDFFAVVSTIESHYFIKHNKLVSFSEQQVVDCAVKRGYNGCQDGGIIPNTIYQYVMDVGLTTSELYPYESVAGPCRIKKHPIVVKLKDYKTIKPSSVCNLKAAIAFRGPVSAGLNGTHLQFISGEEILTGNWCNSNSGITHVVSLVGYRHTPEGLGYWIIKNSWGKQWGKNGYFYVEISEKDPCALTQKVYIPYVN